MEQSSCKKKVVILVDQLYLNGGIERLVALKANYWTEEFGYDVLIVSTEQENKPFAFQLSPKVRFQDLGINFNRQISYFHPKNLTKFLSNITAVRCLLVKEKPSHILVASHIPITYFINFLKRNAITIKEYHYTKYFNKLDSIKAKIENKLEDKFDFNIVLSEEEAKYHQLNSVTVIPNPIDWPIKSSDSIDSILKKRVFFLGRIAPVKNLEVMLEIWAQFVYNGHNDWCLDFMGQLDSDYAQSLLRKTKELGLEKNVVFLGDTKKPQELMSAYDAMLLTSHQECFPMVILEAFANGVPVFAFDCPTGPRNMIIDQVNGVLVPNRNIEAFVNALSIFASNPILKGKMANQALITAEKYNMDAVMQIWKDKVFDK